MSTEKFNGDRQSEPGGKVSMILELTSLNATERGFRQGMRWSSEEPLLSAAKRGKPEAFEALFGAHRERLFQSALRITRNREDAEDALQDSFLRAFVHIKSFHGRSSLFTWLTRIVINSALMIRRKNRNARQISADDLSSSEGAAMHLQIPDRAPNPEQSYVEHERKRVLHNAVRNLRPRVRAVVEVCHLQARSIKETARILNISVAAAKGRAFHARAALRRSLVLRAVGRARTEPAA